MVTAYEIFGYPIVVRYCVIRPTCMLAIGVLRVFLIIRTPEGGKEEEGEDIFGSSGRSSQPRPPSEAGRKIGNAKRKLQGENPAAVLIDDLAQASVSVFCVCASKNGTISVGTSMIVLVCHFLRVFWKASASLLTRRVSPEHVAVGCRQVQGATPVCANRRLCVA